MIRRHRANRWQFGPHQSGLVRETALCVVRSGPPTHPRLAPVCRARQFARPSVLVLGLKNLAHCVLFEPLVVLDAKHAMQT